MDARALRRHAAERLRSAGIENAELDARVLIAHALGLDTAQVLAAEGTVDGAGSSRLEECLARRLAGEPVARIVGKKEFWSRAFALSPEVLVPRPETETLVEAALGALPSRTAAWRILDLGVGSGALLAALLLELPQASGVGVDRSPGAISIARKNLQSLGLGARAALVRGDWAAALVGPFDLIVTNPPYVASGDMAALPREVRDHDPIFALDGGADGLAAYREIVSQLPRLLAAGGVAVMELGPGQEAQVAALARSTHLLVNEPAHRDLSGLPRALVIHADGHKKTLGGRPEPH
jgi:release factor glutamine methyltransferase